MFSLLVIYHFRIHKSKQLVWKKRHQLEFLAKYDPKRDIILDISTTTSHPGNPWVSRSQEGPTGLASKGSGCSHGGLGKPEGKNSPKIGMGCEMLVSSLKKT